MESWIIREISYQKIFYYFISENLEDAKDWVESHATHPIRWVAIDNCVKGSIDVTHTHWSIEKIKILQDDPEFIKMKTKEMVI